MKPKNFFSRHKPSFATGYWFLKDFVLRYKFRLALITLLGAGAAAIQAGMLALLNRYLAGGFSPQVMAWLAQENSGSLLGLVIFLTLATSALLMYLNGRQTLALWPLYQVYALNRIYTALNAAEERGAIDAQSVKESLIPKAMVSTQRMGAFTRVVAKSILPALQFLSFTIVAFSINPKLSLIIFSLIIPLSAILLLYFSRQASQCDRNSEMMAKDATRQMAELLDASLNKQLQLIQTGRTEASDIITTRIHMLVHRFIWIERARLVTGLITVGLLGALFAHAGSSPQVQWGEVFIYLIALMLAFGQLTNLASLISNFGRFYPTVSRYMNLLDIVNSSKSPDEFKSKIKKSRLQSFGGSDLEEDLI